MSKIENIVDRVRNKLYYSQPVYVADYESSPWKKWLLGGFAVFVLVFIFGATFGQGENAKISKTNLDSQQKKTQGTIKEGTTNKLPAEKIYYKVTRVIDGDTIDVDVDGAVKRVRLIGVDTPETVDPRKTVQCFGKEASSYVKDLLSNKMVSLENDSTQGDADKYHRLLRYVYLSDGTNVNKEIIAKGYGHEYTYNIPYKYQADFKSAQTTAENNSIGLWSPTTCAGQVTQPQQNVVAPPISTSSEEPPVTTSAPSGSTYYANCTSARAAGVTPLYTGQAGYRSALDRDSDGVACE